MPFGQADRGGKMSQGLVWDTDTLTWIRARQAILDADSVTVNFPDEGQQTMANSISVAIASDQTSIPVSGTFFQATQPVSIAATVNTDVTDDATRDLGKVDVASLDQYTPVSGRLPVDGSGVTQPVSAASLPLPDGAATAALQGVTDTDDGGIANGQATALRISENYVQSGGTWVRQTVGTPGSAAGQVYTVQGVASMTPVQVSQATASSLNATVVGTGTFAVQDSVAETSLAIIDDWDESDRCKVNPISGSVGVAGGSGIVTTATQRVVLATDVALPAGTNAIGKLSANSGVDIGDVDVTSVSGNVTVIQGTGTNLHTVVDSGNIAVTGTVTANAGSGTFTTKETRAATPSQASVSDSATSVTLLAANASRLGATVANDSSAALYLKLGATASTTSYTARLVQYGYYEVPYGYTGVIDGIWASDPNDGAARVTELT